jgi:hypothetical protein
MKRLLLLALGGAAGYVLGARAGRQRYDQIVDVTNKAWHNTGLDQKAREVADQASGTARDAGGWMAATANDKLGSAREAMADRTSGSSSSTGSHARADNGSYESGTGSTTGSTTGTGSTGYPSTPPTSPGTTTP